MMPASNSDVLTEIFRLKELLQTSDDEDQILDCLYDLFDVNMTVDYLRLTLIGKTVNALREYETIGPIAGSLVRKWKNLVIDEMEESDTETESDSDCHDIEIADKVYEDTSLLKELVAQCSKSKLEVRLSRIDPSTLYQESKAFNTLRNVPVPDTDDSGADNSDLVSLSSLVPVSSSFNQEVKLNELKSAYVDLTPFAELNKMVARSSLGKCKETSTDCKLLNSATEQKVTSSVR